MSAPCRRVQGLYSSEARDYGYNGAKVRPKGTPAHRVGSRGKGSEVKGQRCCDRCQARRADGTQCTRTTCTTGPYCWQHTQKFSKRGVRIKETQGMGKGLYVTKPVKKKEPITAYSTSKSKKYSDARFEQLAPGDKSLKYGLSVKEMNGRNTNYNPYQSNQWQGRYANEARPRSKQNAKIKPTSDGVAIVATKNIRASKSNPRQIFVHYNRKPKAKGKPKSTRS